MSNCSHLAAGSRPQKGPESRNHWLRRYRLAVLWLGASSVGLTAAPAAAAISIASLRHMSIDQLATIKVTSVTKTPLRLNDAPAAIYVITHAAIVHSGATTLPQMLRLAPNLQVAQMSASSYAISARGFNGNAADKLLVLIDGRSIYTPLYGGVYWDESDVPPENIDRIEVISGPGATMWGANAVNGVINIITKKAKATQGGELTLGGGNREARGSLEYGGQISSDLAYRAYVEDFSVPHGKTSNGTNAYDGWNKAQAGMRLDWSPAHDHITLSGDLYAGSEGHPAPVAQDISGGDLQATWQHPLAKGSMLQVLGYYARSRRYATNGAGGYTLSTYDLEAQHSFHLDGWNAILWGAGVRLYQDRIHLLGNVSFVPQSRQQSVADVFVQDRISLSSQLALTAGLKLENDPYSGLAALPDLRLSAKITPHTFLWAAVSRAVRAPTRFDTNLRDAIIPSILVLEGNPRFKAEKLTAYQLGVRVQPSRNASFSVSAYYNDYTDLRSVEWIQKNPAHLPLIWSFGNLMEGHTYGIEVWGAYQPTRWWSLSGGFSLFHSDLRFKPGSSGLGGIATAGDDPHHQANLQSTIELGHGVYWNADLRWVGQLPNPRIAAYTELNTTLTWSLTKRLQIAVSGFNLLQPHHVEYEEAGMPYGDEVYRSFFIQTKWRF